MRSLAQLGERLQKGLMRRRGILGDRVPVLQDRWVGDGTDRSADDAPTTKELSDAIDAGNLLLHYQPQWSLQTGQLVGVEALVRWQRRPGELLAPASFVPLAEATGLIGSLGAWVIRQAIQDARRWQRLAPHRSIAVSVNISAHQLESHDLVAVVRSALEESRLDPASLVLELTESVLVCDSTLAEQVLGELQRLGVRIAIDDFGTGASSLTYLHHFPIDQLKIDRSFVAGIQDGGVDEAIVQNIISLSQALKVEVVAEGIESAIQAELLASWGCAVAQGFLVSAALPAGDICAYLHGRCATPITSTETVIDLTDDGLARYVQGFQATQAMAELMSGPIRTIVETLRSLDTHAHQLHDVRVAIKAAEQLDRLLGDVTGHLDQGQAVLQLR